MTPGAALPEDATALRARVEELEAQVRQLTRKLAISERALSHGERLQALGQLISGVAHELANPMTAVIARATFIRSAETLEEARRQAALIEEQGQRATTIVRNLSAFARRRATSRSTFSLNDVVRAVVELHGYHLTASNIKVHQDLDDAPLYVEGDQYELEQVLLNLITNAHYAMMQAHNGGQLVVRTRAVDEVVRLTVEDDGPGIPAHVLPQIFEAFYTTKGEDGTGLGLAIARDLIAHHGGQIRAEAEEGRGTTMIVELPRRAAPRPAAGIASAPAGARTRGPVLVVDDEREIGELIAGLLRARGFETEYVDSAAAALRAVRTREFRIMVTDLRMPHMSGEDLWRVIRREHPDLARHTIFVTGDHATPETAMTLDALAQPCLPKPFRGVELDEALALLE
jgi:two-component system NtrC family sensor kinase